MGNIGKETKVGWNGNGGNGADLKMFCTQLRLVTWAVMPKGDDWVGEWKLVDYSFVRRMREGMKTKHRQISAKQARALRRQSTCRRHVQSLVSLESTANRRVFFPSIERFPDVLNVKKLLRGLTVSEPWPACRSVSS